MHSHFDSARMYVTGSNIGSPLDLREVKKDKGIMGSPVCVCV
jgi:hypothetical protein